MSRILNIVRFVCTDEISQLKGYQRSFPHEHGTSFHLALMIIMLFVMQSSCRIRAGGELCLLDCPKAHGKV